jgi:hypothetical protein
MSSYELLNNPHYQQMLNRFITPNIETIVAEKVRKERAHEKIRDSKSAWFYPGYDMKKENILDTGNKIYPRTIHIGETEDHALPRYDVPVADADKLNNAKGVAEASDRYDKMVDAFYPEFQDDAQNYLKLQNEGLQAAEAGYMTSADFAPIKLVFTLSELLNIEQRIFTLPDAVQTKQTNQLNIMVGEYNRFQISEDLGELDTVEARKGQYSTTQFSLRKAAGHISWSDEFMMQNYLENPFPIAMQNVASDMVRVKAKKIAAVLATATTTSGGAALSAQTSGVSTNNAISIFNAARMEIYNNFGTADRVAMNETTLNHYLSNTWVRPLIQAPQQIAPTNTTFALPGFPGLTAYLDNSLPDNIAYIWDNEAVWFIQGPVRASSYRDEIPGGSGHIVRDWHKCIVRKTGMLRQLTSLS